VSCHTLQYFSTLSRERHDLKKKGFGTQNVFCVPLPLLSELFVIVRRNEPDIIKNI